MEDFKSSEEISSSGWYDFLKMVRRHFLDKDFSYFNIVGGDSGSHPEGIYPSQDKSASSSPLGTVAAEEIEDVPDTAEEAAGGQDVPGKLKECKEGNSSRPVSGASEDKPGSSTVGDEA